MTALSEPSQAALGGNLDSIQADRATTHAKLTLKTASAYSIHALTLQNGARVQELSNGDGIVFALTWHGPGRPDLRKLLGRYFQIFQVQNSERTGRLARMPPSVDHKGLVGLVLQTFGHEGIF